ncbi:MAG TPA: fimbrial protein [Scandinavium sp.]|jgi:type 1 fimbria pilin|uniref:fimbrial protein n=1 Tax=Scandinavium sp. TaxID=2830653 RepID=UPI002E334701|nr:fimbrial protein [Scandinavium sp.]HEX4503044.1 fimbrial protein [Scandinavium sp.]
MNTLAKIILCSLLSASFLPIGVATAFTGTEAYDLTVSGNLNSTSCKVILPDVVDFGHINIDSLSLSSSETVNGENTQIYNIQFESCPESQQAEVSVSGIADSADETVLANAETEETAASNIAISFWDTASHKDTKIDLNSGTSSIYQIGVAAVGDVTRGSIHLKASLVRPESIPATAGHIAAVARFKITYL